jgi:ubiquinone/menaquinone biosynthesis C-methylase UbiE
MAHGRTSTAPQTKGKTIRWARLYNLLFARKLSKEHRLALKYAAPQAGEKALDVGCGPGTMAVALAEKVAPGGEAVGIDASAEMIGLARDKAKRAKSGARFEAAAIESLPFPDGQFDVATSTFMLHHLPEEVRAKGLAEVRRVLKPGGRFVVVDFASDSGTFLGHLLSVMGHSHGKSTLPHMEAALHAAGFASVEKMKSDRKESLIVKAS